MTRTNRMQKKYSGKIRQK